jgi:hypothetical protein
MPMNRKPAKRKSDKALGGNVLRRAVRDELLRATLPGRMQTVAGLLGGDVRDLEGLVPEFLRPFLHAHIEELAAKVSGPGAGEELSRRAALYVEALFG